MDLLLQKCSLFLDSFFFIYNLLSYKSRKVVIFNFSCLIDWVNSFSVIIDIINIVYSGRASGLRRIILHD